MKVRIFTDGSAKGNPGPGGFGAVLQCYDPQGNLHQKEVSEGYRLTTNNRMELLAAIRGLEALKRPCEVELHSDSQYLVRAFNDSWVVGWQRNAWKTAQKKPVKNVDLWKRLIELVGIHQVSFVWVKGHNGNELNERCDFLATSAADGPKLLIDEAFEREAQSSIPW